MRPRPPTRRASFRLSSERARQVNPGALAALSVLVLSPGCGSHRIDPLEKLPVAASELQLSEGGETALDDRWWAAFDRADLDLVVDEALTSNLDVRAAFARLEAAEATVRSRRSALVPALGAYASSSVGTDDRFDGVQRVPVEVGVGASYEVDLWGRIRAEVRGAARRREATRADAHTAALTVSAEVVSTWIDLAATREQLALLDRQLVANEQMAEIVRSRVMNGVVRQADSLRQDRLVEQTRAEQVARQEDLQLLRHRLAVLMGRQPRDAPEAPATLPGLPPLPATGLPSDLLLRRPDVVSALASLEAADADVAAAVNDLYPQFTLRADLSNAPATPEALVTGWIASATLALAAPLFEGGRRRAVVAQRRALLDAQVADYGTAVLGALQEVEDALAANQRQAERVELIDRQVELAGQTADNLQLQYVGGLDVGYLDVLTAQTTEQQLRRQQITARQRMLTLRVALFRALAGGLEPPESTDG